MPATLRIAFAISSLQAGGAERIASNLSNAWGERGHEIHIVTFEPSQARPHYPLSPAIRVLRLDAMRPSATLPEALVKSGARIAALRSAFRRIRPDAIVSFITEMNALAVLASPLLRIPVVISERSHPVLNDPGRLRRFVCDRAYPWASRLVVQSAAVGDWYRQRLGIGSVVIPNPLDLSLFAPPSAPRAFTAERGTIVSVGRLDHWKGHDLLIDAFGAIAPSHPGWRLEIYGKGPSRRELRQRIKRNGLWRRARLMGVTDRVADVLRSTDIFAFGSRYEGFPNAVVEALGCGCPVVATDCPGASAEILGGGRHGVLVPPDDAPAMAAALDGLIRDTERRRRLSEAGPAAVAPLATPVIAERWIELLRELVAARNPAGALPGRIMAGPAGAPPPAS